MKLDKLCRLAANRYARRCWWAEQEDLQQEARLAAITASRHFDPTVGVPIEAYVWRALMLSLARYLWAQSSPTSGGSQDPKALKRQTRAPVVDEEGDGLLIDHNPTPDELLDELRWHRAVQARLPQLVDKEEYALASQVIFEERKSADVAASAHVSTKRVYSAAGKLRTQASQDVELYSLLRTKNR